MFSFTVDWFCLLFHPSGRTGHQYCPDLHLYSIRPLDGAERAQFWFQIPNDIFWLPSLSQDPVLELWTLNTEMGHTVLPWLFLWKSSERSWGKGNGQWDRTSSKSQQKVPEEKEIVMDKQWVYSTPFLLPRQTLRSWAFNSASLSFRIFTLFFFYILNLSSNQLLFP